MREFFGRDMEMLATVLAILLIISLGTVLFLAFRNRILVKLALRNIPRRPAQTILIVVGLMLSTTIISASLAIGDTVAISIRSAVLDALGNTDIRIRTTTAAVGGDGSITDDTYLQPEQIQTVLDTTAGNSNIDGVLPQVREILPVLDNRTQLTEARMNVVGFDAARTDGFGPITTIDGQQTAVSDLAAGEVFLNESAADEIEAQAGDSLTLVSPSGRHDFTLRAVVREGGLAANDDRLIMSLSDMQRIMGREGQVNRIDVSLLGGREGPADLSEEVADDLRILFTDDAVADQLFQTLSDPAVISAIEQRIADNPGNTISPSRKTDLEEYVSLLKSGSSESERFRLLTLNQAVSGQVIAAVESAGLSDLVLPITFMYFQASTLFIDELKQSGLEAAELFGNLFTTFFSIFGSFSIIVGLLLIFLVFVMLAAERAAEMGIARAVGTKRRHLVQMFTFEGVAYSVGAAIIGTIVGIIASGGLVALLVNAIGAADDGFEFKFSLTATSLIAGFSLGLLLTLATVAVSAYRVSKLNIVVAIRGLPPEFIPSETVPLKQRFQNIGKALISPLWLLFVLLTDRVEDKHRGGTIRAFFRSFLIIPIFWRIILSIWQMFSPYLNTGLPQLVLGGLGVAATVISDRTDTDNFFHTSFFFSMSASLFLVGVGQVFRHQIRNRGYRQEVADRVGFTLMGGLLLVLWLLPFNALNWLTGELGGGIEMFIISGVWMVASAVWVVMYNADLIAKAAQGTFGRITTLRPILKPAIAYPTSSRFRTGLTVAMFALVIFTMMVFSILNNLGTNILDSPDQATGGFEVRAETSQELPISDITTAIDAAPGLNRADFPVIASSAVVFAEARQEGAEELRFLSVPVVGVDDSYLRNARFEMSHYDPSYLPAGIDTDDEVAVSRAIWDRLLADPTLAIVSNSLLEQSAGGFNLGPSGFEVEGIAQNDDEEIEAFQISIRQPLGLGGTAERTVIAATTAFAGQYEAEDGDAVRAITMNATVFDEISDWPVPFTTHRFQLADGVDPGRITAQMETAFLDNSLLATDMIDEIQDSLDQNNAFTRLFQAFMGLGLVVGVTALGVLSFRAVVERRVSIGMMRAIGYKSRMIQVQFLLESVFVTVLGTALGLGLGAYLSWNLVKDLRDSFDGLNYSIPWLSVAVIVIIAIVASLLTTLIPARQASRIYPSEALRYE